MQYASLLGKGHKISVTCMFLGVSIGNHEGNLIGKAGGGGVFTNLHVQLRRILSRGVTIYQSEFMLRKLGRAPSMMSNRHVDGVS